MTRRPEVTATTVGQGNPAHVETGGYYKYNKDPDWVPNDPRYRETIPAYRLAGGEARTERREKRILEFAAVLADLGEPDPWHAPNPVVIEAGKRVGVGEKTAMSYRTALRKRHPQQESTS